MKRKVRPRCQLVKNEILACNILLYVVRRTVKNITLIAQGAEFDEADFGGVLLFAQKIANWCIRIAVRYQAQTKWRTDMN